MYCKRPDRDNPKLECGYPLPCPHHTVIIDGSTITIPHTLYASATTRKRIKQVAQAVRKKTR